MDQEKIKKALYFINAHRDGCTGSLVMESLGISNEELVKLLQNMYDESLIEFANTNGVLKENDMFEQLILITGAYSHPDYQNIF